MKILTRECPGQGRRRVSEAQKPRWAKRPGKHSTSDTQTPLSEAASCAPKERKPKREDAETADERHKNGESSYKVQTTSVSTMAFIGTGGMQAVRVTTMDMNLAGCLLAWSAWWLASVGLIFTSVDVVREEDVPLLFRATAIHVVVLAGFQALASYISTSDLLPRAGRQIAFSCAIMTSLLLPFDVLTLLGDSTGRRPIEALGVAIVIVALGVGSAGATLWYTKDVMWSEAQ